MLRAYRLIITNYEYAPPQLWEWQQPHIDNLSLSARTFGHYMKQRFFLNRYALNRENTRIWHTHYKPKSVHEQHRQLARIAGRASAGGSRGTGDCEGWFPHVLTC